MMFKNDNVENCNQKFKEENISFEPDSSPKAWEHYKKYYSENSIIGKNYDLINLTFFNYYKDVNKKCGVKYNGKWYNYANKPKSEMNRLYALERSEKDKTTEGEVEWYCAIDRVGGECDFNFNDKKYELFERIIWNDKVLLNELEECLKMHHSLLNFSLIPANGNLQGVKGENIFDRPDTFINELNKYFSGISANVLRASTSDNKSSLKRYLNNFKDIYEYCKEVYFIENESLINRLIENGEKPIFHCDDVKRYMDLAKEFWSAKEFYFNKNAYLTIGDYFLSGGETYKNEELLLKLEIDLGYDKEDATRLIEKCVQRGFIIDCGNEIYTR